MLTLLCEVRLCTAPTSCLIFLTSTIMHFGLRASLQTRPLCDLPNDITKCQTKVLCGCDTQLMLQLPHFSHFKVTFVMPGVSILRTDCMTAPLHYVYMSAYMVLLNPTVHGRHSRYLSVSSAVMHCSGSVDCSSSMDCSGSMDCCFYIDA